MSSAEDIKCEANISKAAPFVELHQCLVSSVAAISPFVDRLMRFIRLLMQKVCAIKENEDEIEIALSEALVNAVIHGNREKIEKCVYVICRCSMDGEVLIVVRDEGEGFDSRAVPDPTEPQSLLLNHGRGLHLMRALMDEVSFEAHGTVVRMRKRLPRLFDVGDFADPSNQAD